MGRVRIDQIMRMIEKNAGDKPHSSMQMDPSLSEPITSNNTLFLLRKNIAVTGKLCVCPNL